MTPATAKSSQPKTPRPVVAAWQQAFRLAAAGSACHTRGLIHYRAGAVSQVHAAAGQFHATVTVKKGPARHARITFPQLDDGQWRQLADRLADDAAAVADLLAGKVPGAIAAAGPTGGPSVVPPAHRIGFFCDCLPRQKLSRLCDHSAALGHAVAGRLTTSASTLLSARGMHTRELAEALRGRLAGEGPRILPVDASGCVRADHTYTLWANRAAGQPPPAAPPLDRPEPVPLTDPPAPAPRARDLGRLVQDAASRARALLDGRVPAPHDGLADTVRLLASAHSITRLPGTAARTGHTENELRRLVIAYRHGGAAGLHAAAGTPASTPESLAAALAAVRGSTAVLLGDVRITGDCLTDTAAGIQLRPGLDGHWYPFTEGSGQWRPAPGHSPDPVEAYRAARRARTARPAR